MVARIADHFRREHPEWLKERTVRFALLDSDVNDLEAHRRREFECFHLSDFEKQEYADLALGKKFLDPDEYISQWLPEDFRFVEGGAETGFASRLTARLGLYYQTKHKDLISRLRRILEDLVTASHRKNRERNRLFLSDRLRIAFCFSLAGSTGSGIFLPLVYLLRDQAVEVSKPEVLGLAVLPEVFKGKLGHYREVVFANAYAALKETEWLMRLGAVEKDLGRGQWRTFHYNPTDQAHTRVHESPFNLLYLVGQPEQEVADPVSAAADGLYQQLSTRILDTQVSGRGLSAGQGRLLVPRSSEGEGRQGFTVFYGTYGSVSLRVPEHELRQFCSRMAAVSLVRALVAEGWPHFLEQHGRRNRLLDSEEKELRAFLWSHSPQEAADAYVSSIEVLRESSGWRLWDFYYEDQIDPLFFRGEGEEIVAWISQELRRKLSPALLSKEVPDLQAFFTKALHVAREVCDSHINGRLNQGRPGLTLLRALGLEASYHRLNRKIQTAFREAGAGELTPEVIREFQAKAGKEEILLRSPEGRDHLAQRVNEALHEKLGLLCRWRAAFDDGVWPAEVLIVRAPASLIGTMKGIQHLGSGDRILWLADAQGDSREILFYRSVLNLPLFRLEGLSRMREAYLAIKKREPRRRLHIDHNWEDDLPDLFPEESASPRSSSVQDSSPSSSQPSPSSEDVPAGKGQAKPMVFPIDDARPTRIPQGSRATIIGSQYSGFPNSWDFFLAHAGPDQQSAEKLYDLLDGRFRVFLASRKLMPGDSWPQALAEAQRRAAVTVVLISENTPEAWYQEEEILQGIDLVRKVAHRLVPVYLGGRPKQQEAIPYGLWQLHSCDALGDEGLQEVAQTLARLPQLSHRADPALPAKVRSGEEIDLTAALEEAQEQLETLTLAGDDTTQALSEIRRLKRRLREGGRLRQGDILGGRFRLDSVVGGGGFAKVWKGIDRKTGKVVAVKVLHGQYAEDRSRRERFFRGARQMARLDHEGIVRVVEPEGEDGGYHYFVMEFLEGGDFRQAVLAGRLDPATRLQVVLDLGKALAHAHGRGVIHRDVKPANILLTAEGNPKLTDFDLVRAADTTGGTRTQAALGTFIFAAPEALLDGAKVEAKADVYSLAMTTIFALAGQTLPPVMLRHPEPTLKSLDCSEEVRAVLFRGISWDLEERFGSVEEYCGALRQAFAEAT